MCFIHNGLNFFKDLFLEKVERRIFQITFQGFKSVSPASCYTGSDPLDVVGHRNLDSSGIVFIAKNNQSKSLTVVLGCQVHLEA